MSVFREWVDLARTTFRSVERADVADLYRLEWAEARSKLVEGKRAELDSVRGALRHFLRTSNAVVYGLTQRLAPVRRVVFAAALALVLLGLFNLTPARFADDDQTVEFLFGAFVLVTLLLALELVDKIRFRDELVLARELQANLISGALPEDETFEFAAFNKVANMVGGDVYEFLRLPDGRVALLFGDASGHGMAAGLVMAVAHAAFHTQVETDPSPAAMSTTLNRILCRTGGPRSFFSCVYMLLAPDGTFAATVSGHPPMLRVGRDGIVRQRFGTGSYPLGIRPGLRWEPLSGEVSRGESLVLYSDGLSEASDGTENQFGEERIESILRHGAGLGAASLTAALSGEAITFCGRRPPEDDVSIAVIRRK